MVRVISRLREFSCLKLEPFGRESQSEQEIVSRHVGCQRQDEYRRTHVQEELVKPTADKQKDRRLKEGEHEGDEQQSRVTGFVSVSEFQKPEVVVCHEHVYNRIFHNLCVLF